MRTHTGWPAACLVAVAGVLFAGAASASEPYDIDVYQVSVKDLQTGSATYSEGRALQIKCYWSVTKASATTSWAPMAWNSY
ncbi:MAG TPA: hypothetical protein VFF01_02455, partial [Candidatus Deferrimicrobiaceae bacterium]|nr:hypothetical protein [Candidatus Deferrimicrobiaceae bacterium]